MADFQEILDDWDDWDEEVELDDEIDALGGIGWRRRRVIPGKILVELIPISHHVS